MITEEKLEEILNGINVNIWTKEPWRFDLVTLPGEIGWLLAVKFTYGEQEERGRQAFISPEMDVHDVDSICLKLFEDVVLGQVRYSYCGEILRRVFGDG